MPHSACCISVPYPELFWSWYTGLGSQTQTSKRSKVLISGVNFRQRSLSQSQESNVLRYLERKIAKKFPGFCPWTPLGRAYSAAPDSPAAQRFFSSLHSSKKWHPQKIAGYSTVSSVFCSYLVHINLSSKFDPKKFLLFPIFFTIFLVNSCYY